MFLVFCLHWGSSSFILPVFELVHLRALQSVSQHVVFKLGSDFLPPYRHLFCPSAPVCISPISPESIRECIADCVFHSSTSAQTETQCVSTHRGERLWNIARWDSSSLMLSIKECVARQLFPQNCMYLWLSAGRWLLHFQFPLCFFNIPNNNCSRSIVEDFCAGVANKAAGKTGPIRQWIQREQKH